MVRAFDQLDAGALKARMGDSVETACVVTAVARQISRRDGSEWGRVTVEGFHGTATVLAFKDAWRSCRDTLQTDAVVLLRGKVSDRERDEEDPPVFLDAAEPLKQVSESGRIAVQIQMDADADLDSSALRRARTVMEGRAGSAPVEVVVGDPNGAPAPRLRSRTLKVKPDRKTIRGARERVREGTGGTREGALARSAPRPARSQQFVQPFDLRFVEDRRDVPVQRLERRRQSFDHVGERPSSSGAHTLAVGSPAAAPCRSAPRSSPHPIAHLGHDLVVLAQRDVILFAKLHNQSLDALQLRLR